MIGRMIEKLCFALQFHILQMKWFWANTTQIGFGVNAVNDHLSKFIKPNSKILCTFGFGSIDKNGARSDVQSALDALHCEVKWEGGIPANPEYDRLLEIAAVVRSFQPDLVLAVGGGSVLDGTKFLACVATLPDGADPWEILTKHKFDGPAWRLASVITLPATGSEWNNGFVISRRSIGAKRGAGFLSTYPQFSLIDPRYTLTLPPQQLSNGVYDAFTHCIDQFLTPQPVPMTNDFYRCVVKELVTIGPEVVKEGSSLELHERLIMAASFACNQLFALGGEGCWAIHQIGHQLTAKYGIDHGATLAIVTVPFLETQFEARKEVLAKTAEFVFGVKEGTVDEKARAFLSETLKFIRAIGQPTKVSEWKGATIADGDVQALVQAVLAVTGGNPVGWRQCATETVIREVLTKVVQ
jgi:alcohol dehydrogenase YqhD (iron-dependent ADH family)